MHFINCILTHEYASELSSSVHRIKTNKQQKLTVTGNHNFFLNPLDDAIHSIVFALLMHGGCPSS